MVREQRAAEVQLAVHPLRQPEAHVLGHDLTQDHLLREVLGAHGEQALPAATEDPVGSRGGDQTDDNFFSAHPSPPSASRAMSAAGTAPARISVVSTEASPRKMNTPSPPPPMAAAIVAVPIVVTVATRTPARIVRAASGSSTSQSSCRPVIPMAIADSRTARSTPRMPVSVFRNTGRDRKSVV